MTPDKGCKQNCDQVSSQPAKSLYVHVPFCLAKCRYCDFYSIRLQGGLAGAFVAAAAKELTSRLQALDPPLGSVFLGGGTPTVLGGQLLGSLLAEIRPLIDGRVEFTIEANPGTIEPAVVEAMVQGGVNRVSIGVQSFDGQELNLLGRIHTPRQAQEAVGTVKAAGIENLSLDLIYGIPGQTMDSWRASVSRALELGIEHLSCYALSLEEGTELHRLRESGQVQEMNESLQKECYYAAIELARSGGLEHYEISNFARPGRQCRHNLTYWHNEPYIGIGPGAASYLGGLRQTNRRDLNAYLAALSSGQSPPAEDECLGGRPSMAETIMLGLRLIQGLDRSQFISRYGQDAAEAFPNSIGRYAVMGVLIVTPSHIRLSTPAIFVADSVLADILAEA